MAVLSDPDRLAGAGTCMDPANHPSAWGNVTKADIRAAFNGLDDYFDSNATQINNAIPQPARGNLTAKDKALIAMEVLRRRYLAT